MSAVLQMAVQLESITCGECGIEFAMPVRRMRELREKHGDFWCPNGHARVFTGKTEAEKLREQLAEKERDLVFQRSQREAADRRAEEAERKVKRAEAGVCTLCNRTVRQMAAHMASKHPHADAQPRRGRKAAP